MDLGLEGSVALVTGASQGIGAAIARALGRVGCRVTVHYHRGERGAAEVVEAIRADGGYAQPYSADLTSYDSCESLVDMVLDTQGRIDVLVNNAGDIVRRSAVSDFGLADFDYLVRLNFSSVFQLCRLVGKHMAENGSGSIINVSSAAARNGGGPGTVPYAAAKGAVSTLTRGLAKELAPSGVRVNTLAPGLIDTPLHKRYPTSQPFDKRAESVPMGRAGSPEECAGAALFLASSALSSYVTGQSIEVNGGLIMP